MKRKLCAVVALIAALAFGLGAFSSNVIDQLRYEFQARNYDNLVNRDLMRADGFSPSAAQYFQGKADANQAAARLPDYAEPYLSEYLLGYSQGLFQASELLDRARAGVAPVPQPGVN